MMKSTKDKIQNGAIVAFATAPFWLTAVFAIANLHDQITIDRDGNILEGWVTRDDYRELGAFSFDKTGQIYKSFNFGIFNTYSFLKDNSTHIYSNTALPKFGILVTLEKMSPTQEELSDANRSHKLACNVIRKQSLKGYENLNCPI